MRLVLAVMIIGPCIIKSVTLSLNPVAWGLEPGPERTPGTRIFFLEVQIPPSQSPGSPKSNLPAIDLEYKCLNAPSVSFTPLKRFHPSFKSIKVSLHFEFTNMLDFNQSPYCGRCVYK